MVQTLNVDMDFDEEILEQGELISDKLNMLRLEQYPPIKFYKQLGATPMEAWTVYRVDGDALPALAEKL